MHLMMLLTIALSVLLSAASQIMLKTGMISDSVRDAMLKSDITSLAIAVLTKPIILLGFLCFGASLAMWLLVLARIPLSTAYPFVALGIGVTVAAGVVIFGEPISMQKVAGVGLIIAGIVVVASA